MPTAACCCSLAISTSIPRCGPCAWALVTFMFKGTFSPAEEPRIKKDLKPADVAQCMMGGGNHILKQEWLVGKDNALANVVVSLEPPEGARYKIDDELRNSFKKKTVVLDQPFCAYVPHVSALYADVQPFVVKNSAKFSHNTNIKTGPKNVGKNNVILAGETWDALYYKYESTPITISCEQHPFMSARLLTFYHPYFAVTKDDGSFEIANVPTGEELVLYVWHESMDKKTEFKKLTFKAGDNTVDGIEIK